MTYFISFGEGYGYQPYHSKIKQPKMLRLLMNKRSWYYDKKLNTLRHGSAKRVEMPRTHLRVFAVLFPFGFIYDSCFGLPDPASIHHYRKVYKAKMGHAISDNTLARWNDVEREDSEEYLD